MLGIFCFLVCFVCVRDFAFRQQSDFKRLCQFTRADLGRGGEDDELFGLAVLVSRDRGLDRIDLKHRRDRRETEFLFDAVLRLRAALGCAHPFAQDQFHEIVALGQSDRRAVHEGDATMQSKYDREVRSGIAENVRSADHCELEMSS